MKIMRNARGFTLLEILIVLVIIAVLAGLAIPAYTTSVEKSRAQEALQSLSAAKEAMLRFHAANGTYAGAVFGVGDMDFNPNNVGTTGQGALLFSYSLFNLGVSTFSITATRQGGPVGTITITQAAGAAPVRTGVYA